MKNPTIQQELRARASSSKISNQALADLDWHRGRNLCGPRSFAAEMQLSTLGNTDLQLRSAEGKAINIFGWRTVQLLTQSFSICITFAIADVEQPLLGLGSLLASNLSLHIDKNLGHHLSNSLGEQIQLEQRGLQLYLSACLAQLGFNLPNQATCSTTPACCQKLTWDQVTCSLRRICRSKGSWQKLTP